MGSFGKQNSTAIPQSGIARQQSTIMRFLKDGVSSLKPARTPPQNPPNRTYPNRRQIQAADGRFDMNLPQKTYQRHKEELYVSINRLAP
jgi:hypothetical protein